MIKVTHQPTLTEEEAFEAVRKVINKGKFAGSFQAETFIHYPTHKVKVVSWHDGEQTSHFHVTRTEKK